jgi:cytochrome b subunit of formate dehydrogenase
MDIGKIGAVFFGRQTARRNTRYSMLVHIFDDLPVSIACMIFIHTQFYLPYDKFFINSAMTERELARWRSTGKPRWTWPA